MMARARPCGCQRDIERCHRLAAEGGFLCKVCLGGCEPVGYVPENLADIVMVPHGNEAMLQAWMEGRVPEDL